MDVVVALNSVIHHHGNAGEHRQRTGKGGKTTLSIYLFIYLFIYQEKFKRGASATIPKMRHSYQDRPSGILVLLSSVSALI